MLCDLKDVQHRAASINKRIKVLTPQQGWVFLSFPPLLCPAALTYFYYMLQHILTPFTCYCLITLPFPLPVILR